MVLNKEIYNCATGETQILELSQEEINSRNAVHAKIQAEIKAEEQKAAEKAAEDAARLSAKLAIYAKLGLTEEEINTLIS